MITENEARGMARHWVQAWNSHDLDEIMSHYGEGVVMELDANGKIVRVVANYNG